MAQALQAWRSKTVVAQGFQRTVRHTLLSGIVLQSTDLRTCANWAVESFDAFADRSDILPKIESGPCELPEKVFSCKWHEDALDCALAAKS